MKRRFLELITIGMVLFCAFPAYATTLTIASGTLATELQEIRKLARMFEKEHPDITVKVLDTPEMTTDRLGLYLQFLEAKSPKVDVYQVDVTWPGDLSEHFVDLNKYGARDVIDQHFEALVQNNTVNGRLVALPWFLDGGLFYYRTDLLEKYGLKVPETWDDMEKAAKIIQDGERKEGNKDFWGFVWQGDAYEGLTCNALEWISSNNGGSIISSEKKITVNNENAIEMIQRAADWIGTISPKGVTEMHEEPGRNLWQSGNAAFLRNWPYVYPLANAEDSAVRGKFGLGPLPAGKSGKGASTLGGWQLSVSKYSRHPELAAKLALFLTSAKAQKQRAVAEGRNPTIKSLYQDRELQQAIPYLKYLYTVFEGGVARPSTASAPQYSMVSQLFFKAVYSVLTGTEDARTALEELELDLQDMTGFEIAN